VLAPKFSEQLGQNFLVENVSGRRHHHRHRRVARATADGHTLLLHNLQISANVRCTQPAFAREDLATMPSISTTIRLCWSGAKIARRRYARRPDRLDEDQPARIAHPGKRQHGIDHDAVRAGGQGPVNTVLIAARRRRCRTSPAGHIDLNFATPQAWLQAVAAGQIKGYGITAKEPRAVSERAQNRQVMAPRSTSPTGGAFAPAGTAAAGHRQAQCRAAGVMGRSGDRQGLGRQPASRLSKDANVRSRRAGRCCIARS